MNTYVYAVLLLKSADKELNEENITRVLQSAGLDPSQSRVKALVASLEELALEDTLVDSIEEEVDTQQVESRKDNSEGEDRNMIEDDDNMALEESDEDNDKNDS